MSTAAAKRRVVVACTACRAKKVRCNGQLPSCERCLAVGRRCVYDFAADRRKPPSKKYVESLERRISELEEQLENCHRQRHSDDPQGPALNSKFSPRESLVGTESIAASDTSTSPDLVADYIDDLTQLYGRLEIAEDGHLRYFGPQSYFNLKKRPQYEAVPDESLGSNHSEYGLIAPGVSKELQTHLLELFWTWQNPWQYMVHKASFCEAVERESYTEYCTPLLLQSVLALAARYSPRPELRDCSGDAETAGNAFADQAKAILHFEMERPTVSTVVSLLLMSLREMSVNNEPLGWCYVGLAVRLSFNLGLNHDCTKWLQEGKITEDRAEIHKITFWACFMLDKLFVIALGRPGMIQRRDITVPKPSLSLLEEYEPWTNGDGASSSAVATSHAVSNMHYTCAMFEIGCEALEEIYAPNSNLSFAEKETKAGEAHAQLEKLHNSLPSFMKLTGSTKTARPAHVYSFYLQFYCVIILLHRPFLGCNKYGHCAHNLPPDLKDHHKTVCVHAAERISWILRTYRMHYTLRAIPISGCHCVGTASVIQLLGATSKDPSVARSATKLLKFNIECLREMSEAWMWSTRTIRCIEILAEDWGIGNVLAGEAGAGERGSHIEGSLILVNDDRDEDSQEDRGRVAGSSGEGRDCTTSAWSEMDWSLNLYDWAEISSGLNWMANVTI